VHLRQNAEAEHQPVHAPRLGFVGAVDPVAVAKPGTEYEPGISYLLDDPVYLLRQPAGPFSESITVDSLLTRQRYALLDSQPRGGHAAGTCRERAFTIRS
jgi:hypothetical protein